MAQQKIELQDLDLQQLVEVKKQLEEVSLCHLAALYYFDLGINSTAACVSPSHPLNSQTRFVLFRAASKRHFSGTTADWMDPVPTKA